MDTSTLIQAKKQARNLLNKLIKLDGLDPAQKKELTNINKQVHYQIKQLNREEELKMKTIELSTWESDRVNGEWDYTLHGIEFEIPEELKAACKNLMIYDDDLKEYIFDRHEENLKIENLSYRPFYNQTIRRDDIAVSFNYSGTVNLGELDSRLEHITLTFSGSVYREENEFNDEMAEWLQNKIEAIHKAAFKEWPSIPWLPKLDFNCSEYRLDKLTKSRFQSLADQARNTYEFERLEGEKYDQAYELLDELDARERELYSEFI